MFASGEAPLPSPHFAALVAGLGHDLRAPLHAILGMGELLLEEMREGPVRGTWRDDLHGLCASGRRLAELLDLILDVARIESGKATLKPALAPLDPVVVSIVDAFRAEGARIDLRNEGAPEPVLADERRFQQVLQALLRRGIARSADAPVTVVITRVPATVSIAVTLAPDDAAAMGLARSDGASSATDPVLALVHALCDHARFAVDVHENVLGGETLVLRVSPSPSAPGPLVDS